ncbi:MBL fold metallo-hydrolase [Neomicrococcus lactis]|uniref:MBL fold metallo-hydrolase n=1 Tax=Neomicrococcus lactis TaxID=732241 RepID=UPI00230143D4|nr:MBL fold metallo-hydrolase [Neomicrococcus lactis]
MSDASHSAFSTTATRIKLLRANNPGPMTLTGTNTYALSGNDGDSWIIVDPGPSLREHLHQITELGRIELILITHHHPDHTEAIDDVQIRTGAPVRAFLQEHCRAAEPLEDREIIEAAGTTVKVLHTPGHTADSACFILEDGDRSHSRILTGDTILGQGTTILDYPDGTLVQYLKSLDRLATHPNAKLLPGHGPVGAKLGDVVRYYQEHRADRLGQITSALDKLGLTATDPDALDKVTNLVYSDVPENLKGAARKSVDAQLHYLTEQAR